MKKFRKLVGLLMVFVMAIAMTMTSLADGTGDGKITINKAISGYEYSIYRIFDLKEYDKKTNAYKYTINSSWGAFVNSEEIKGHYISLDTDNYVTWKDGASASEFAEKALAYATSNSIGFVDKVTAAGSNVYFANLPLGYYLIDSSVGTLCMLNTTDKEVTIEEKNGVPVVEKYVQENNTKQWGEENDADIGMTVNFNTHIHTAPGTKGYILHDKMSEGLTFDRSSIKVFYEKIEEGEEIEVTLSENNEYTVSAPCADNCTFELIFKDEFINKISADKILLNVSYSATLNEKAVVGGKPGIDSTNESGEDGNINETELQYNDTNRTNKDTTKTYTYKFDLVKTDKENILLDGAVFKLYNYKADALAKNDQTIKFIYDATNNIYRVATKNESSATDTIAVKDGKVTIVGLEGNCGIVSEESTEGYSYWLVETQAPNGYHLLTEPVEIEIINKNEMANAILKQTVKDASENEYEANVYNGGGFQVINNSGTILPSTGGMGTTLLYIAGGALVLIAVVLLITKKRMSGTE